MTKLVFITGASSGLGQALAAAFYEAGYSLALAGRRTMDMERWAETQGYDPRLWRVYAADVTDRGAIAQAGQACMAGQGVPDVVIANAGISVGVDTALAEDLDDMTSTFSTNVLGVAATFQPFIAPMKARHSGTLVGIGSVAGIRGLPGHGAYCASKAAVIAYCESLRGELRGAGIKVVTICPGYIDTPLTKENRYPMPFLMQPEDFARQALRTVEAGRSYRVIPWQMAIIASLLRMLPNWLFDVLFAKQPRKHRRTK